MAKCLLIEKNIVTLQPRLSNALNLNKRECNGNIPRG